MKRHICFFVLILTCCAWGQSTSLHYSKETEFVEGDRRWRSELSGDLTVSPGRDSKEWKLIFKNFDGKKSDDGKWNRLQNPQFWELLNSAQVTYRQDGGESTFEIVVDGVKYSTVTLVPGEVLNSEEPAKKVGEHAFVASTIRDILHGLVIVVADAGSERKQINLRYREMPPGSTSSEMQPSALYWRDTVHQGSGWIGRLVHDGDTGRILVDVNVERISVTTPLAPQVSYIYRVLSGPNGPKNVPEQTQIQQIKLAPSKTPSSAPAERDK